MYTVLQCAKYLARLFPQSNGEKNLLIRDLLNTIRENRNTPKVVESASALMERIVLFSSMRESECIEKAVLFVFIRKIHLAAAEALVGKCELPQAQPEEVSAFEEDTVEIIVNDGQPVLKVVEGQQFPKQPVHQITSIQAVALQALIRIRGSPSVSSIDAG